MKLKRAPRIKNRIRYHRTIQQKDLAFLMEKSQAHISHWENGDIMPRVDNAIGLEIATHRLVEDLFPEYYREWKEKIKERIKFLNIR